MALDREWIVNLKNGERMIGSVGNRFVGTIEILDAGGLRDLTSDTLSVSAFAPADSTSPTVTITAQANQTTTGKGLADIAIAAAQFTAATVGTGGDTNAWQLDAELLDSAETVVVKYLKLQVEDTNAA